jgi:putative redox protein
MGETAGRIVVRHLGRDRLGIDIGGHELISDQPVEDGGEGMGPAPTEIFLAGLAGCVGFFAERYLRRHGLSTDGLRVRCDYTWAENPHRVGAIELRVEAPSLQEGNREAFMRVIEHCTVHNTLLQPPPIRIRLTAVASAAA